MKSNLYKKDLVSAKFAGELSGYSSRYLRRLARAGKIEGVQVGRIWMVKRGSLVRFLDAQTKYKEELSLTRSRVRAAEYHAHLKKSTPTPPPLPHSDNEILEKPAPPPVVSVRRWMPNENLITTKEAGELSGYTPDYVSRLVRSGKISGKKNWA